MTSISIVFRYESILIGGLYRSISDIHSYRLTTSEHERGRISFRKSVDCKDIEEVKLSLHTHIILFPYIDDDRKFCTGINQV